MSYKEGDIIVIDETEFLVKSGEDCSKCEAKEKFDNTTEGFLGFIKGGRNYKAPCSNCRYHYKRVKTMSEIKKNKRIKIKVGEVIRYNRNLLKVYKCNTSNYREKCEGCVLTTRDDCLDRNRKLEDGSIAYCKDYMFFNYFKRYKNQEPKCELKTLKGGNDESL